jgi:hypothetical protein
VPSIRLARLPITTADIADGAVTTPKIADLAVSTAKLADAAVTPAKVGAGVMSSRILKDHMKASYTLDAGGEESIYSASGNGSAAILFAGDGDGAFRMRVYVDGELDDEFPTDEARVSIHGFTSSLEVRVYNPAASPATATSSSFNLSGVAR